MRVYGVSFLIAAPLLFAPTRFLLMLAASISAAFVGMVFLLDFSAGWNFETLDYAGLWTAKGATRNLLFNGFRAVFPWTALLLTGICLGRIDWSSQVVRHTTILCGLVVTAIAEVVSQSLLAVVIPAGTPSEDAIAVFGTDSPGHATVSTVRWRTRLCCHRRLRRMGRSESGWTDRSQPRGDRPDRIHMVHRACRGGRWWALYSRTHSASPKPAGASRSNGSLRTGDVLFASIPTPIPLRTA